MSRTYRKHLPPDKRVKKGSGKHLAGKPGELKSDKQRRGNGRTNLRKEYL